MIQFKSVLKDEITEFMLLRKSSKSKSTYDYDQCTLKLFDEYLCYINCDDKNIAEAQVTAWIGTLTGKSNSIANVVIVVRLFLTHLKSYGINAYIPPIPKVSDDYIPYIFSDDEMKLIFSIADNLQIRKPRKNTLIHIELPMILSLKTNTLHHFFLLYMKTLDPLLFHPSLLVQMQLHLLQTN